MNIGLGLQLAKPPLLLRQPYMELLIAIFLFTFISTLFPKYLRIGDESSAFHVFLKGVYQALVFMTVVLTVSFFLPNFSWSNIWTFLGITLGLALISGTLEVVKKNHD
jgi:hypothetical protein